MPPTHTSILRIVPAGNSTVDLLTIEKPTQVLALTQVRRRFALIATRPGMLSSPGVRILGPRPERFSWRARGSDASSHRSGGDAIVAGLNGANQSVWRRNATWVSRSPSG